MWTQLSFVLLQTTLLTDRRTDRQTDIFLMASQRWHSMQRSKDDCRVSSETVEMAIIVRSCTNN